MCNCTCSSVCCGCCALFVSFCSFIEEEGVSRRTDGVHGKELTGVCPSFSLSQPTHAHTFAREMHALQRQSRASRFRVSYGTKRQKTRTQHTRRRGGLCTCCLLHSLANICCIDFSLDQFEAQYHTIHRYSQFVTVGRKLHKRKQIS